MTEQEAVQQSVQRQSDHPSAAPTSTDVVAFQGGIPINEFTTEGYFTCAFPTLFPTGAADFLGQRHNQVTVGNYFKHLMVYEDGRFAKHPRFRFFALNTDALACTENRLNLRSLRSCHWMNFETWLVAKGKHYASTLRATRQYWFK